MSKLLEVIKVYLTGNRCTCNILEDDLTDQGYTCYWCYENGLD
jgi:hypothetical protein